MAADWVIVVDDDRNDQRLACEMLRRAGIQTSAMRSGAAALDYIRKGGMPDLILLDVNMPGTDGFETLRLLREQMDPENEIPVVLMTGEEEQEVRGLEEGAMDIIRKPLEGDVVISRDDPMMIYALRRLSRETMRIVQQNFALVVGINTVGLILGASSGISVMMSALMHNMSTILVVANSLRLMFFPPIDV